MVRKLQIQNLIFLLYILLLVSIVFTLRAITSITVGLLILTIFIRPGGLKGVQLKPLLILFLAYFIWQLTGLVYSENLTEAIRHITLQTGIVLIPFSVFATKDYIINRIDLLLKIFILLLLFAFFICTGWAAYLFFIKNAGSNVFFYHDLVKPLEHHAILVSIFCYLGVLSCLKLKSESPHKIPNKIFIPAIILLPCFILLLSSKLVIAFCFFSLLIIFIGKRRFSSGKSRIGIVILLAAVLTGFWLSPVSDRFKDITIESAHIGERDSFHPDVYFNGLEFRLLQWRIVPDILSSENTWWIGTGPGDAQDLLNKKYRELNMYQGSGKDDNGYLGYNTHNQFLESLLQSGIVGLSLFLLIFCSYLRLAFATRNVFYKASVLIICLYCLNESVFETQYAIILFCFFPLFIHQDKQKLSEERLLQANPSSNSLVYN